MAKTAIEDLAIVISASADGLASDLRGAMRRVDEFKKTVERTNIEMGSTRALAREAAAQKKIAQQMAADQKRAAKEAKEAWDVSFRGRAALAAGHAGDRVGGFAKSVVAGAVGGVVGAGVFGAMELGMQGLSAAFQQAKESVNLAAELEQTQLAFEVMLKSGDKAKAMLADIRQFAASTPFNNAELTDSGRKLIAYGIAADQVVPTLRMLGDVAAATQTPISDLAYLYGTLAAQQRAYTKDIYQFANRGIPIYEELAKVLKKSVAEVKDLVEEGKVGFPEVVRAFKGMTEGKGLYAGLTARQADTFAGVREQLFDTVDQLKIKFGKVLIDQLGLKDAAKELSAFTQGIDSHVPKIERAVKFVGDLGRAGAQVAAEFGRAGLGIAAMNLEGLGRVSPEFAAIVKQSSEFVENLKQLKLDEENIARIGLDLFAAIGRPMAQVSEYIVDMGRDFEDNVLTPLRKAKEIWDSFKPSAIGKTINDQIPSEDFQAWRAANKERYANRIILRENAIPIPDEKAFDDKILKDAAEMVKAASDLPFFNPPRADEPLDQVRARYTHLSNMIEHGRFLSEVSGWQQFKGPYDALQIKRADFLKPYSANPVADFKDLHAQFKEGRIPARRPDWVDIAPPVVPKTKTQVFDEEMKKFREEIMARAKEQKAERLAAEDQKRATEAVTRAIAGFSVATAIATGELGGIRIPDRPDVPWSIPADVQDVAKRARDQFPDPLKVFRQEYSALNAALFGEMIDLRQYGKLRDELVNRTATNLGIGPTQLPEGMERGSQEATRLINQIMSGTGQKTVQELLQQILDETRKANSPIGEVVRAIEFNRPRPIDLSGLW